MNGIDDIWHKSTLIILLQQDNDLDKKRCQINSHIFMNINVKLSGIDIYSMLPNSLLLKETVENAEITATGKYLEIFWMQAISCYYKLPGAHIHAFFLRPYDHH